MPDAARAQSPVGLARAVAPGEVIGIDLSEDVLAQARDHAESEGVDNVTFTTGDVYQLDYEDGAFDVVYANQLLQHLTDQVRALQEMRRVLKPGGILTVRDTDYATMSPSPKFPEFDEWSRVYHGVAYHNNAEPDAGRQLARWVREAGFVDYELHPNVMVMDGEEARRWGSMWSQRILRSNVGTDALAYGIAKQEDLERISRGVDEIRGVRLAVLHVRPDGRAGAAIARLRIGPRLRGGFLSGLAAEFGERQAEEHDHYETCAG